MDLKPLDKFIERINKISTNMQNLDLSTLRMLMLSVQDEVRKTYPMATVTLVDGTRTKHTAKAIISVNDKDLWFKEFGTGAQGRTSFYNWQYTPTQTLTFFSRGQMQSTSGWEYEYHPETKKLGYWWYNGKPTDGQIAQMGVTNAIVTLKMRGLPMIEVWMRDYLAR